MFSVANSATTMLPVDSHSTVKAIASEMAVPVNAFLFR